MEKIIPFSEAKQVSEKIRKEKKIVFTNGVFDLVHKGHLTYLAQARDLGDCLWVGLNSDSSVKRLKGPERPVNPEEDRALLLSCLSFVDFITVFTEDTPLSLISQVAPHIHSKGGDYNIEALPETPLVRSLGGEVQILPFVEGFSSTELIRRIRENK
ncbi:D-glycero-beta-D-manno-heptose 1-phosphate adenylyltransferase [Leptospira langatensis]|uniref:D-glycero-beta-D-manno-heptose 1-phosphate adenylyltransferase n=1 Tax=Leptospira langatensis TaxID=2484983 RepID=A0A5F1ZYU5_9LEPT|nr:D-glycero-beta-D-manno-heptose 1-phosphate adenylyltransferase [Leptospira langatensis]TGK04315.1 D-glycero-beta-D-manno-heptose 1-phosphate adenylyltransferase [Leptospira langatensis]TGL43844.1 D-glycero-beta-D-manno-heptose 1-phosphate adenylyltransferase [Leptospira langatensis]